jgi:hypothetical protein
LIHPPDSAKRLRQTTPPNDSAKLLRQVRSAKSGPPSQVRQRTPPARSRCPDRLNLSPLTTTPPEYGRACRQIGSRRLTDSGADLPFMTCNLRTRRSRPVRSSRLTPSICTQSPKPSISPFPGVQPQFSRSRARNVRVPPIRVVIEEHAPAPPLRWRCSRPTRGSRVKGLPRRNPSTSHGSRHSGSDLHRAFPVGELYPGPR